ncbi:hypothetical protein C3L33_08361, partial [Rhododendron williamsianum]
MDPPPKSGVKLRAEHHELKIANSCNGLLCLCEPTLDFPFKVWRNPIAVCNPITGEYINLPDPIEWDKDTKRSLSIHCGLGFSPKMNQYKVIRFREPLISWERERGSMTEIHTLVPPPPFKLWKIHKEMTWEWVLGVLGGCLCVCDGSGFEKLKIWVMKEYGVQESWSKELCFITQTNEGRWIYGTYDPICLLRNGAICCFIV